MDLFVVPTIGFDLLNAVWRWSVASGCSRVITATDFNSISMSAVLWKRASMR